MPQDVQIFKPTKINRDADPKYLPNDAAFFMLNNERSVNADGTLGKNTPMAGNELLCQMEAFESDPYCVLKLYSPITREAYFGFSNPEGLDYIVRVNEDATCEIVNQSACLNFLTDPRYAVEDWRVFMKYDKICAHRHGKQIVWVDGSDNPIWQLDVEASIQTNNFTTPFFDICSDECAPLQMCVPESCGALEGEFIPLDPDDIDLPNHLLDIGIQVRFRHIYYDERANEWSDISTLFFQDAKGCFNDSEGLSRCLRLRVPVGNPLVDKIQIAFSTNNGTNWFLADTINKYQPYTSEGQYWYERELADLLNFSEEDCSFDYIFCNDKECAAIDPNETNRIFNPMPRAPQGFVRIKDSLGFYNYIKGNCPLLVSETKKIEVSLDCNEVTDCTEEYVNVVVRAIIHNNTLNRNQYIYRFGGQEGNPQTPDNPTDPAFFGGMGLSTILNPLVPKPGYKQFFIPGIRNFLPYVEGMAIYTEMKQYRAEPNFITPYYYGVVSSAGSTLSINNNNAFFFQEGTIKVKKGTRGFIRLTNHHLNDGLIPNQKYSTQVIGTLANLNSYNGNKNINGEISPSKEVYFDTCSVTGGELIINETFVIQDGIVDSTTGNHSSTAYEGYITDNGNKPVAGAEIWKDSLLFARTDHNGYYYFYLYGSPNTNDAYNAEVRVELDCAAFANVKTVVFDGDYSNLVSNSIKITDTDNPDYETTKLQNVDVLVTDCNGNPAPGIRVALTGDKYKITGSDGKANFKLRNYSTRNRIVRGIVMNNNYCISLSCDGECNPCMPQTNLTALPSCFTDGITNIAMVGNLNVSDASIGKKGLKAGGRYQWQVVVQGDCGRLSAAYPITVLDGSLSTDDFMNVPKTQSKEGFSFCGVSYDINGFVPPVWGNCLKLLRSKNLNGFELQWKVDSIEKTADNKIKLTIQSLNDYNASFNFETNTAYEYFKGDRVEFINNGDGSLFDIATFGLLNYQILSPFHDVIVSGEDNAPANFFNQILIEDDGKLDSLKAGAIIEIQRPKECVDTNTAFFEIGVSLPIVLISGVPTVVSPTGAFTTFDTYLVNRQIGENAPQSFESKNPSDFWGDALKGISDVGKVHFENKYENEKRFGRNITINTLNQFNRFGDFEKTLDAPEQGDLVSVGIYDGKIGLGIAVNDSFLFQISDDFLKVGSDGIVRAAPVDSLISDTEPKVSGIFGCQYEDIGSIFYGDGFVSWIDSKRNADVKHNFSSAKDISLGKMKSWFSKKIQIIKNLNSETLIPEDKYRWVTGWNTETNVLIRTVKKLTDTDINNTKDALLQNNETLLLDPLSEEYLTFAAFTQEAYSNISLYDARGCAFLSVYKGNIYRHPIIPLEWDVFNGTATDWVIGISVNQDPRKIKIPLSAEVQSEQMFYVSKVETDKNGFDSEIPAKRFTKTERKWNSSFLFNKNNVGGLYSLNKKTAGEQARGYWIKVTFLRDNTLNLAYNTIDTNKQKENGRLDLILIKYQLSEQSGFTNNK